ncbi:MAG: carbohydrate-binding domain-containing protein, partial [Lachnospiraceae bacterium]|nr:carbohydrate-binding domain-containing protein [Lachnospiraceae bacterium]
MGTTKRIIGIFLSLVLVLGVVPMIGLTSKAATYAIRIGDSGGVIDRMSGASGTGWSYAPATDSENATLTLTNANISGGYGISSSAEVGDINIVLVGNNTITSTTNEGINIDDGGGFLTISGEGTLTVNASSNGIKANNVTLDSGAVTVNANGNEGIYAYNSVVVNGGSLNVTGVSLGIKAIGVLEINDGNFNANGNSCGVDVGS